MRQIKGREKTQGNSRKSFTNAKERKGRIREQESAGQLNNKAKTQNNISLSKNRIKNREKAQQRMAETNIKKVLLEKDRILPEKLIQDSTVWVPLLSWSWSSRNDSRTCLRKRKTKSTPS